MSIVHFPHRPGASPLPATRLSPAELSAARLDGDLSPLGEGYAPADALSTPPLRAASLAPMLGRGVAAIGLTAAWVHGGLAEPPALHHLQRAVPHRLHRPVDRRVRYRDTALDPDDVELLGGVLVTTRVRTLVDLARESTDPLCADAARRLACADDAADALTWIDAHRRLPARGRAREFLQSLLRTT